MVAFFRPEREGYESSGTIAVARMPMIPRIAKAWTMRFCFMAVVGR